MKTGIATLLIYSIFATSALAAELRTWTAKSGSTVVARFVEKDKYYVTLEDESGKKMQIRITNLVDTDMSYLERLDAIKEFEKTLKESAFILRGTVSQNIDGGILVADAIGVKKELIPDPKDKVMRIQPNMVEKEKKFRVAPDYEPVVVFGAKGRFDGDTWEGIVYPSGTYKYETVLGAEKTVLCYDVDFYLARKRLLDTIK